LEAVSHSILLQSWLCLCWQSLKEMGLPNTFEDLSSEMEVDAFRRLFPLRYFERHLAESIRPDGRPLGKARETSIFLG